MNTATNLRRPSAAEDLRQLLHERDENERAQLRQMLIPAPDIVRQPDGRIVAVLARTDQVIAVTVLPLLLRLLRRSRALLAQQRQQDPCLQLLAADIAGC